MFQHSVKVPRHYKVAANIFKKVSTEGGSVKTLLYDDKLRHFRTNVLYALITETIKHAADIDKIFESCSLVANEPRLDLWLAKILTAELLFGKKALPGQSKPEQTILSYKEQFEKYTADHQEDLKTEVVRRPRYVRVNTNLLTTSDAIRAFQDEEYRFIRCTSGSYDDYLTQIKNLAEYDFTQDYHVKTVFVFSSGTKLHEHELYMENKIILQDKATTLAVHLLAAPQGSVAMDMCAAPGMKTTQLAAYMRNEGKIYAVERNVQRYHTLCDFVEKTGSKCVETINKDALEIRRGDYDDVEYILLDPSCSGSGMELCVHNYIEETRLAKLTSLQEKFLKHAMNAFPNAKRIVYSTCSIFPEENERVITNVVKTSRAKWRVQDVKELLKGQWNNFGSGMYGSMGTRCLYARTETDLTTGFFLAVLDRDPKYFEKKNSNVEGGEDDVKVPNDDEGEGFESVKKKKKNKKHQNEVEADVNDSELVESELQEDVPQKKKKRKHKNKDNNDVSVADNVTEVTIEPIDNSENVNRNEVQADVNDPELVETELQEDVPQQKKKRKHKNKDTNDENVADNDTEVRKEQIDNNENAPKKKKRKHQDNAESVDIPEVEESSNKKKDKRKKQNDENTIEETCRYVENVDEKVKGKKKKKKRDKNDLGESEN